MDHPDFELFVHEPPHPYARAKRLRPHADYATNAPAPMPISAPSSARNVLSNESSKVHSNKQQNAKQQLTRTVPLHSPDHSHAMRHQMTHPISHSQALIPNDVLLDYLTADSERLKHLQSQLPPDFHRVDAYLLLRERDPQSLSALSFGNISHLIQRTGREDLGGVLTLLLQDIIGDTEVATSKAKPGFFNIQAGTEERYKLLRDVLVRCLHGYLLNDGTALNVFTLMLDDLIQVRQLTRTDTVSSSVTTSNPASTTSPSEDVPIHLPSDFPVGEALRLVKLVVHVHSPELAPILKALRSHLESHTPWFPTAREGSQLIAYYLQPNLRDFRGALDVVRGLRDTNAVPQEVVDDAIRDGKNYLSELNATLESNTEDAPVRPSPEELQQISLEVTLRLIATKCMMAQRPKGGVQFRKAFESLIASLRLDLVDLNHKREVGSARALLDVPFRSLRSAFLHLVGRNEQSCLAEALHLLQRCDQLLVAMLPSSDLQEYFDAAKANNGLRIATEVYALVVKAKASLATKTALPVGFQHSLARDGLLTDADTFITLMRQLLSRGQRIAVIALLRALRLLPMTHFSSSQLALRFSSVQKARMIALLAKVGLPDDAFEMFQLWSHYRYEPHAGVAGSLQSAYTFRKPGGVKVADPLIERQIRLMHDSDRQVAISTECLVPLVRSICRSPLHSDASAADRKQEDEDAKRSRTAISPEQRAKAAFVIRVFIEASTPMDWTHYRLTALARACFIAEDVPGAFDALAKISHLREIPDQVDIAVLLGGLVEHDADRAVDFYIRHCSVPENIGAEPDRGQKKANLAEGRHGKDRSAQVPKISPMKASPALTSTLITRTMAQGRLDLVEKLYAFSKSVGISTRLGYTASVPALFLRGTSPSKVTKTINSMLQNGWPADPSLLENLAQRLLSRSLSRAPSQADGASMSSSDSLESGSSTVEDKLPAAKERLALVQSAVDLMRLSTRSKEVVNLRSIDCVLDAITAASTSVSATISPATTRDDIVSTRRAARQRGREERRREWIACLDSTICMLRWTRFFDTGDDYRQSLPLWKSSPAGGRELVSAELDELIAHGYRGSNRRHHKQAIATSAAATLPNTTEGTEALVDGEEKRMCSTDGVVQYRSSSSPNVLPPALFHRLIETYLALEDVAGAAEVASWMRDEAKVDLANTPQEATEFIDRVKAAVIERNMDSDDPSVQPSGAENRTEGRGSSGILRMLAGQQSTARTKSWWTP